MSIKPWDSLKKILKMKTLQCQSYVNINDLTSRIPLSLWHYRKVQDETNTKQEKLEVFDQVKRLFIIKQYVRIT